MTIADACGLPLDEQNRPNLNERITAMPPKVKQLLTETNMTLEQMAPLSGYSHKESLSAVFKREAGATPGEYRRRIVAKGK